MQYKYFAFISYNAKDTAWGKRVQKKLEGYRMPATLCSERGWKRKPIRPVFFAPTDIQPGGLDKELQERLRSSRHLIVICSPNSAKSKWVGEEIAYFHSLGRADNIHFFIVDGTPHSGNEETECFNPIVEKLKLPEILGANIHEKVSPWPWVNRERAYVQLVTKLLGVEFDKIWQRHKRLMWERAVSVIVGVLFVIAAIVGVWLNNQPVDVRVCVREVSAHNNHLPALEEAVVTLRLDNEVKTDTICSLDSCALFANIPHAYLGKEVQVTITAPDWLTTDTILTLSSDMVLLLARNPQPYGDIQFVLWDARREKTCPNVTVQIDGHEAVSDAEGRVEYAMPLSEQRKTYEITASQPKVKDILYMPNTESTMIEVN